MKNERELFEAWHNKEYADKLEWCIKKGEYKDYIDEVMWQTWQASTKREGFKLAPVEATKDMIAKGNHIVMYGTNDATDIYKAMIGEVE